MLAERIARPEAIDRLLREAGGFAMGPFELIDLIGADVNLSVTESVFAATAWDTRYAPHIIQQELVRAGRFGRKSGAGFYDYRRGREAAGRGHGRCVGARAGNLRRGGGCPAARVRWRALARVPAAASRSTRRCPPRALSDRRRRRRADRRAHAGRAALERRRVARGRAGRPARPCARLSRQPRSSALPGRRLRSSVLAALLQAGRASTSSRSTTWRAWS